MKKLPIRAGVGLIVLNSPLTQVSSRFRSLLPEISSHVEKLLYVHILPESNSWPPKALSDSKELTDNIDVARWTKVSSTIYRHAASHPTLDLRLVLDNAKTSLLQSCTPLNTKHQIDVVFFDPLIKSEWIEGYKNYCLTKNDEQFLNAQPKEMKLQMPITLDTESVTVDIQAKSTDKLYHNVVLGGTFDRIHAGHKILLTTSLLRCKKEITIGITDGESMMKKKVLPELILPCQQRIEDVREFIQDVDSTLKEYRVVPILDPFGPSTEDNSLQLIIGSQETSKGCLKVNEVRKEKGLSQLDIHVIDLVDDDTVDKYSPENEGKVSSSSQRMRLLGIELKAPEKKWICSAGPYVIGLTGGSCSGKTNISKYLESLGAGVVNCDLLGHAAYAPGTVGFDKVVEEFGSDIVDENGVIDRRLLGRKVFGRENHSQMQKLEAIVWPEIWKMAQEKIAFMWKKQNKNVIIVDAAVLLQAGWKENVNQLWVSIVDTETAVQRIVQRDARTEEEARQRLSNQISNNQYVQEANVVFCSKWEISYTQKQVDKAWEYTQKTYIQE